MNLIGTMSEDLVLKGVTDSPCSIAERRDYYSHFMYVEIRFRSYTSDPKECKSFMVLQFWEVSIILFFIYLFIFFFPHSVRPLISEANSDIVGTVPTRGSAVQEAEGSAELQCCVSLLDRRFKHLQTASFCVCVFLFACLFLFV